MVRRCHLSKASIATVRAVAVFLLAASATIAAPVGTSRTSGYRHAARSGMSPKQFPSAYDTRSGFLIDSFSIDGPYDLLMDAGTVFTLRNAMDPYRRADIVYAGPEVGGAGSNPVTPAPGAALLAALGLGMVGFVRKRVGIQSPAPGSTE